MLDIYNKITLSMKNCCYLKIRKFDPQDIGTFSVNKVHSNGIVMIQHQLHFIEYVNVWCMKPYYGNILIIGRIIACCVMSYELH